MKLNDNTSHLRDSQYVLELPRSSQEIISEEVNCIVQVIFTVIISASIALFGIFSNVINMAVFYRQGFNTTTNISFFALALSDMFCLITTQWYDIALNPYLEKSGIQFVPNEVQYLTGGWFHIAASRITSWITVLITAERCLGITLPLKVKQIITLRRTKIAICIIWGVNLSTLLPEYSITYLDWKFVPAKNRTLFGLVYRSYKDQAYYLTYIITSASGTISFVCVILLTMFLVTKLAQKSKWRKMATSDNSETVSSRDKKTVKMVIMIAIVLIVCYIPGIALALVSPFIPEFMLGRELFNTFFACWAIAFAFDTVNSSVNVFLYYRMSTKYRQSFNELFSRFVNTDTRSSAVSASRRNATECSSK